MGYRGSDNQRSWWWLWRLPKGAIGMSRGSDKQSKYCSQCSCRTITATPLLSYWLLIIFNNFGYMRWCIGYLKLYCCCLWRICDKVIILVMWHTIIPIYVPCLLTIYFMNKYIKQKLMYLIIIIVVCLQKFNLVTNGFCQTWSSWMQNKYCLERYECV